MILFGKWSINNKKWKQQLAAWSLYYRTEIVLVGCRFYCWIYIGGNNMKRAILDALEAKYQADIAHADATLKIYLENSVGIGEHPQHIEECDKLVNKIAEAKDKVRCAERI